MMISIIDTVGHSPISLAIVVVTLIVAVVREVMQTSGDADATWLTQHLSIPILVLGALFVLVIGARVALILQ